jgi:hypothetical protein
VHESTIAMTLGWPRASGGRMSLVSATLQKLNLLLAAEF